MDTSDLLSRIYPFQDEVLAALRDYETEFYLTGGTGASRGYLGHRLSEYLDLFVNDDPRFVLWAERAIKAWGQLGGTSLQISQRDERFFRLVAQRGDLSLKIDLVNDVPSRVGQVRDHPLLGRLDSPENILSNKVGALIDRREPKDLADVWAFCTKMGLSLASALDGAQGKAAGVFPPDLARVLCSVTDQDWLDVRWIAPPGCDRYRSELNALGESLIWP